MKSNRSREADSMLRAIARTKGDDFWLREREKRALGLFHQAAQRVPAYKDFLKKNHIKPNLILDIHDFLQDLMGSLRSTATYIGARQLKEFPKRATFLKVNRQLTSWWICSCG